MVILDTDHLTLLEWEDAPPAKVLNARLVRLPIADICTTIINFEEQARGWLGAISGAKKLADQLEFYSRLLRTVTLFCGLRILPFDALAAVEYQKIRKQVPRLGTMDQRIASVALVNKAIVLSRNKRDFSQVPGLVVEDWTKEEAP
ncbi:MAG: type II toxin-antitoxin system VapC family toxin [Gemmataceae bacterium]